MMGLSEGNSAQEGLGTGAKAGPYDRLYILVILSIGTFTFLRGFTSLFVAEDFGLLLAVASGGQMWRSLLAFQFRPIRFMVNLAIFWCFGPNPMAYHAVSLLFHLATSVLVFYLGKLITGRVKVGGIAGLVFLVYVRHHMPVVWMAANLFLYMTFFYLLALYVFLRYLQRGEHAYYGASLVFFALAMFSNEAAITVIPMLFVAEALVLSQNLRQLRELLAPRIFAKYLPYVGIVGVYTVLWLYLRAIAPLPSEGYHFVGMGLKEVQTFVAYTLYLVYPFIPLRALDPNLATMGLSLATLAVLIFLFVKGSRVIRFCITWMIVTILPFVLFVPFGNSDRYFYLPSVGFSILLGTLLYRLYLSQKLRRSMKRVAVVLILSIYVISSGVAVHGRISEWIADGQQTASVVSQVTHFYPRLPPSSRFYFVNLPTGFRSTRGYDLLRAGLEDALRLEYGDCTLDVLYGSDPQIVEGLESEQQSLSSARTPGVFVLLWSTRGVLEDRSEYYAKLEERFAQAVWEESFDPLNP